MRNPTHSALSAYWRAIRRMERRRAAYFVTRSDAAYALLGDAVRTVNWLAVNVR